MMIKAKFSQLNRGDQFIGNPHGGWKFIKTDRPGLSVRVADGTIVEWNDDAEVYKVNGCNLVGESI